MLILVGDIEVLGFAVPMVSENEALDVFGYMMFLGKRYAVEHMGYDDLSALQRSQMLVRGNSALVLGKEDGAFHLADVMVEGACAHQLRLGPYLAGHFCTEIRHLHGMLEGAGGYLRHALQERIVHVAQLDERDVAGEAKDLLEHPHHRIGEEQQDTVDGEADVHPIIHLDAIFVVERITREEEHVSEIDEERGTNNLRALGEFAQRVYRCHAGRYLQNDELVVACQDDGDDEHHGAVDHKGGAGVHEDAEHYRHEAAWEHEDVEYLVRHHESGNNTQEDWQRINQGNIAHVLEVVSAEQGEVNGHQQEVDEHEDNLTDELIGYLRLVDVSFLVVYLVRTKDVIDFICDGLATVDNLLACLHEAVVAGDVLQLTFQLGF